MMNKFAAIPVSLVLAFTPATTWQTDSHRPAHAVTHAKKKITLTGQVAWSPDLSGGCLVLRTPTQTYQILDPDRFMGYVGTTQTMRGRVRTDLIGKCFVPVFEVSRVAK